MKIDRYGEIFAIEIEGWCYGIEQYPGEIHPALVHRIVKELGESFRIAIQHEVVFDIVDIARRITKAAKYLVPERDVALSVVSQLPTPRSLADGELEALHKVIDKVEVAYPGITAKLQKKWSVAEAA